MPHLQDMGQTALVKATFLISSPGLLPFINQLFVHALYDSNLLLQRRACQI